MSMVPAGLISTLAADADAAIQNALATAAPSGGRAKPGEVDYVAAVVQVAVHDIASRWSVHVKPLGIRIEITGVFIHASPQVRFPYPGTTWSHVHNKRRELGDLLVVHDDVTSGSKTDRVAVLVQAKCDSTGRVTSPDKPQLHLYEHWPPFESVFNSFGTWRRDFSTATTSGTLIDCGRYGIIRTSGTVDWFMVTPATPPLNASSGTALGRFMAEMVGGHGRGYGREAVAGGTDHWSKTIDDLLSITGVRTFSYAPGAKGRATRRVSHTAMMTAPLAMARSRPRLSDAEVEQYLALKAEAEEGALQEHDGGPDGPPPPEDGEGPRWRPIEGINTIYMVTTREGDG